MKITLKDNVIAEVSKGTTVEKIAEYISESLARTAICGKINGKLVDLSSCLGKNCKLEIITSKDKDAEEVLWHSSSHILAQAVKAVYPNAKLGSGGTNEKGFYYDFDFKSPVSESDLGLIEEEMAKIINANFKVLRVNISKQQAFLIAEENEEPYKLEFINNIPDGTQIGLYSQGDFSDFCDGPHLKTTGQVKAFKLTGIEKSYHNNDESSKPLTRIYGVSFFYKKDLDHYLKNQDNITKRNHLLLGKTLEFFGTDIETDEMILLPKGQRVINSISAYATELAEHYSYNEISALGDDSKAPDDIQVEAYRVSSKKSLVFPLRYFTSETYHYKKYDKEKGLFACKKNRRHKFVVFSTLSSLESEFKQSFDMVKNFYKPFGFELFAKLYVGDVNLGGDLTKVKTLLKKTLDKKFGPFISIEGGYTKLDVMKVEYILKDYLGRDFVIGNSYIDLIFSQKNNIVCEEDGRLVFPITIVNNVCKSYERLLAILIESYAGVLPYWLAPTTVKIVAGSDYSLSRAKKLTINLRKHKVFADLYTSKRGIAKIDPYIPYTIFIGDEECKNREVRVILGKANEGTIMQERKFVQDVVMSKRHRRLEANIYLD